MSIASSVHRVRAVALTATVALCIAGCGGGSTRSSRPLTPRAAIAPMGAPAPKGVDLAFLAAMVPHDRRALAGTKLAERDADHAALRALAARLTSAMAADALAFGNAARRLRAAGARMGSLGLPQSKMRTVLDAPALLRARSFDRVFISELIADDDAAIHMAGSEAFYGRDPQLRRLAGRIVLRHAREVELIEGWENRWYTH